MVGWAAANGGAIMGGWRGATAAVLILMAPLSVPGMGRAQEDWRATGDEVVALVRDRFFDEGRARAWAEGHARYADGVRDRDGFAAATRRALGNLRTSHTAYYTPDDPEYYGLLAIFREPLRLEPAATRWESIGVDIAPGHFVRVVFAGSPAERAGLRRGDQILGADGADFHPVRSFRGRSGRGVTLSVQSRPDGPRRDVVVVPRPGDPREEWLDAEIKGAKVVAAGGKRVAYIPLFSAAGDGPRDALRDAIIGDFANADALIIDFRNGWGGADPTFLTLFDRAPPVLDTIGRDGTHRRYDPQWRKPLVVLINEGARSGKEVVAFGIKRHKLGTLVGTRTGGAVVAGSPFLLRDRSLLYLAVADTRVDGERLEGRGVAPDMEVLDDLPFAEGRDPQLTRALEIAGS